MIHSVCDLHQVNTISALIFELCINKFNDEMERIFLAPSLISVFTLISHWERTSFSAMGKNTALTPSLGGINYSASSLAKCYLPLQPQLLLFKPQYLCVATISACGGILTRKV